MQTQCYHRVGQSPLRAILVAFYGMSISLGLGEHAHLLMAFQGRVRTLLSRLLLRVEELAEILAVQFDATIPPSFDEDLRPMDADEAEVSAFSSLIAIVDRMKGS